MRRILAVAALLLTSLLGLPATGGAEVAADPLGGGTVLFNPLGPARHCTASFAAVDARGLGYLVTEAACADLTAADLHAADSSGNSALVGSVVSSGSTYTVVRVRNTADWELVPWIDTGAGRVVIAGSRETPAGGAVCVVDRPAAFSCGTVLVRDDPVGPVSGLTRTDLCATAEAVAFVSGDQAQGVPASESSFCTTIAGTSWFAPINPILERAGLSLLTG